MTRIELGGVGLPIPTEALPDGLVETGIAPLIFAFDADDSFDKTEWTPFGFTIFEIFCVGGAGGRGGRAHWKHSNRDPYVIYSFGGGGGGGGLHIVSGLLADLDDVSPVVVGQAGANGADGTPTRDREFIDPGDDGEDGGFSSFATDVCMASGGKGGKASAAQIVNHPYVGGQTVRYLPKRPGGDGGEGGVGGQTTAGGGASGGTSTLITPGVAPADPNDLWSDDIWSDPTPGAQGFWDGTVGEGGGGGVGGHRNTVQSYESTYEAEPPNSSILLAPYSYGKDGTDGGRGSFSYADTSKYGQRGVKSKSEFQVAFYGPLFSGITSAPANFYNPGDGGGARPTPLAKYGGHVAEYSPNGLVIVKIS